MLIKMIFTHTNLLHHRNNSKKKKLPGKKFCLVFQVFTTIQVNLVVFICAPDDERNDHNQQSQNSNQDAHLLTRLLLWKNISND